MAEAVEPRRRSVLCASPAGLHRIAYREWGDPRNRDVLVCVHGLTRSGRDFDELARALCAQFRIVCPDVAGRGDSDRLADAKLYTWAQYVADMVTLIARLDVETVNWLGTSMGGFVGMALAAQAASPVKKLVLNDAGPVIGKASLERIANYVGQAPAFATLEEAEKYVRAISAPFGPHSDAQWRFLTETWVRRQRGRHLAPALRSAHRRGLPRDDARKGSRALARSTTRCAARRCSSAASTRTSFPGRPPRRWRAAARRRKSSRSTASATRRRYCIPTQIAVVRDFLLEGEPS